MHFYQLSSQDYEVTQDKLFLIVTSHSLVSDIMDPTWALAKVYLATDLCNHEHEKVNTVEHQSIRWVAITWPPQTQTANTDQVFFCHWSKFAGLLWGRDLFKQEIWGDSEKKFASAVVLQGKLKQKHWLPPIREKLQSGSNLFKLLVAQIYIYIHYLKHSWRIHKIRSRIMWCKWICYTGLLCQRSKFERPRAYKNGTKLFYFLKAVGDHLCRVGVHGNVLKLEYNSHSRHCQLMLLHHRIMTEVNPTIHDHISDLT